MMAVGYDYKMAVKNETCDVEAKGALLIRNSWVENGVRGWIWLVVLRIRPQWPCRRLVDIN